MEDDIYIRYLQFHFRKYGTINNIKARDTANFEGQFLKIGSVIASIRTRHRKYMNGASDVRCAGEFVRRRYEALEKLGIVWDIEQERADEQKNNDLYIEYLKKYYVEHGTINDIKKDFVVDYRGERLQIYRFLIRMRYNHRKWEDGSTESAVVSELALARYAALDSMKIEWNESIAKKTIEEKDDLIVKYLRKHFDEFGTINDITTLDEFEFEKQILKVGAFIANMRKHYKAFLKGKEEPSELLLMRYSALNEMNFDWNLGDFDTIETTDSYIKYLRFYYKEHGTINDISKKAIVEFEGETLEIGAFLSRIRTMHRYFENKAKNYGASSQLSLYRYQALEEMQIDWEPSKTKIQVAEDKYIRYLRAHYQEYGTINNITARVVVDMDGEILKIGNFVSEMRKAHRNYIQNINKDGNFSKRSVIRYRALEEMHFDWNPDTSGKKSPSSDSFIDAAYFRYLQYYYDKYGGINFTELPEFVIFEGRFLEVDSFISDVRKRHLDYIRNINRNGSFSDSSLRQYAFLEEMNFCWNDGISDIARCAREHNIPTNTLYDYLTRFNGNMDKAVKFCLRNKTLNEENTSIKLSKYSLKKLFVDFDIDIEILVNYLNRESLRCGKDTSEIRYSDEMTLKDFCIINGYNFDIIGRAVRLKVNGLCNESFDSLINRCIIDYEDDGKISPATWIYSKYGNELTIKHMFLFIGADSGKVLRDMSWNVIGIEDALMRESFRKCVEGKRGYLQGVFYDFVGFYREICSDDNYDSDRAEEELVKYASRLATEYQLSKEEFKIIMDSFSNYTAMIYQYHLFDVGFEKDSTKKVAKIIAYRFDDDDIEEAFFVPLKFEQRVLLGRNSELYQRRVLLKNLAVSWNDLTVEEKANKEISFNLTAEELHYIDSTRQNIDRVKTAVYKK